MTDLPETHDTKGAQSPALPPAESYDQVDKFIIVGLITVFLALFLGLLAYSNQPIFTYWSFIALLTLVFAGILRATGIVNTNWMTLGGSIAVFIGLIWTTQQAFERFNDSKLEIAGLEAQIGTLEQKAAAALKEVDDLRNQDLAIVTLNPQTRPAPRNTVVFRYWLSGGGDDKPVPEKGAAHAIPAAELAQLSGISLQYSLLDAKPGRPGSDEVSTNVSIAGLRLITKPLQLDLFVHPRGGQ